MKWLLLLGHVEGHRVTGGTRIQPEPAWPVGFHTAWVLGGWWLGNSQTLPCAVSSPRPRATTHRVFPGGRQHMPKGMEDKSLCNSREENCPLRQSYVSLWLGMGWQRGKDRQDRAS